VGQTTHGVALEWSPSPSVVGSSSPPLPLLPLPVPLPLPEWLPDPEFEPLLLVGDELLEPELSPLVAVISATCPAAGPAVVLGESSLIHPPPPPPTVNKSDEPPVPRPLESPATISILVPSLRFGIQSQPEPDDGAPMSKVSPPGTIPHIETGPEAFSSACLR